MGRAQINQTISAAPSPAPPPYFDSGLSLQCQVQVFYFWWRLFTVFCCLLPFAIAGACYWFWRKYLRDNRQVKEFLRDPTKWCFREMLRYKLKRRNVDLEWTNYHGSWYRPSCHFTIDGLRIPNPEPPPGVSAWTHPDLLTIGRVHMDWGHWTNLLSFYGVEQRGNWAFGSLVACLVEMKFEDVNLQIEQVKVPKALSSMNSAAYIGRRNTASPTLGRNSPTTGVAASKERFDFTSNLKILTGYYLAEIEAYAERDEAQLRTVNYDERTRNVAACYVQRWVRGHLARKRQKEAEEAARCIQKQLRSAKLHGLGRVKAATAQAVSSVESGVATLGKVASNPLQSIRQAPGAVKDAVTTVASEAAAVGAPIPSAIKRTTAGAIAAGVRSVHSTKEAALGLTRKVGAPLKMAHRTRRNSKDGAKWHVHKELPSMLWIGAIELSKVQVSVSEMDVDEANSTPDKKRLGDGNEDEESDEEEDYARRSPLSRRAGSVIEGFTSAASKVSSATTKLAADAVNKTAATGRRSLSVVQNLPGAVETGLTNTVHGITNLPTTAAERINKATESLESVIESTGNKLAEVGETAAAATDRLLDETIQIGGHAAGAVVNVHHHVSDAQKRVRSAAAKRREKAMRSIINRMATLEEFSLNDLYGEWDNVMSQISKAVIKRILLESTGLCVVHTAITDTVQNTKDFGKFIGRQASAFVHDPLHRAAVLLQSGVRRKQAVNEASRRRSSSTNLSKEKKPKKRRSSVAAKAIYLLPSFGFRRKSSN